MNLNSRFKSMFNVGRKDIDSEYENMRERLSRKQNEALEKFKKSPDYVGGVTNRGITRINSYYKKKFGDLESDYKSKLKKFKNSLHAKQMGKRHNEFFNKNDF